MSDTNDIGECLARIKEEINALEKELARGSYMDLAVFKGQQGILFGLEKAHNICYKVLVEDGDAD